MAYREPGFARSILVDFESAVPLYRQIADGVRTLIATGALGEGDTLPSVRKLGDMLGVNLNTVAKAYRVLADEAVVELKHGAAARVLAPIETRRGAIDDDLKRALADWVSRARIAGASRADAEKVFAEALTRFYDDEEGRSGG